jgi:hypothetical protein
MAGGAFHPLWICTAKPMSHGANLLMPEEMNLMTVGYWQRNSTTRQLLTQI